MKKIISLLACNFRRAIASKWFWWLTVALFILQAAWVAILFRFPLVYDELFHLNAIKAFSDFISPIIINQSPQYDSLGNMTFGSVSIYHYLMSFPYRIIHLFTQSEMITVVILRLLNIVMATGGFILFGKLFRKIGIRPALVNISMFILAFIPILSTVSATINYDNAIFLLTPLVLLIAVRILNSETSDWRLWALLFIIGAFASLIKFTFLPVFLIVIIFVGVFTYKKYNLEIGKKLAGSFRSTGLGTKIVLILAIILIGGLFSFRYGVSVIKYGSPIPSCEKAFSKDRCLKNPVMVMEQISLASKSSRKVVGPLSYIQKWILLMFNGYTVTSVNTTEGMKANDSPYFYEDGLGFFILFSMLVLLYAWRGLKKSPSWYLLLLTAVWLLLVTLLFNMSAYYTYHENVNVQPRYSLSVLPIILTMGVVSLNYCLRRWRSIKMLLVIAMFFFTAQGGGIVTHVLGSDDSWYWNKKIVIDVERSVRAFIDPLVKN